MICLRQWRNETQKRNLYLLPPNHYSSFYTLSIPDSLFQLRLFPHVSKEQLVSTDTKAIVCECYGCVCITMYAGLHILYVYFK